MMAAPRKVICHTLSPLPPASLSTPARNDHCPFDFCFQSALSLPHAVAPVATPEPTGPVSSCCLALHRLERSTIEVAPQKHTPPQPRAAVEASRKAVGRLEAACRQGEADDVWQEHAYFGNTQATHYH
eukprot:GHVT01017357.1.p3 GENE.GHVT01017357.1~~GHVT01017357.1.p3  ORF type:complete len:128 (-),score=21.17 GHVT01017357.1:2477-2860(-)